MDREYGKIEKKNKRKDEKADESTTEARAGTIEKQASSEWIDMALIKFDRLALEFLKLSLDSPNAEQRSLESLQDMADHLLLLRPEEQIICKLVPKLSPANRSENDHLANDKKVVTPPSISLVAPPSISLVAPSASSVKTFTTLDTPAPPSETVETEDENIQNFAKNRSPPVNPKRVQVQELPPSKNPNKMLPVQRNQAFGETPAMRLAMRRVKNPLYGINQSTDDRYAVFCNWCLEKPLRPVRHRTTACPRTCFQKAEILESPDRCRYCAARHPTVQCRRRKRELPEGCGFCRSQDHGSWTHGPVLFMKTSHYEKHRHHEDTAPK